MTTGDSDRQTARQTPKRRATSFRLIAAALRPLANQPWSRRTAQVSPRDQSQRGHARPAAGLLGCCDCAVYHDGASGRAPDEDSDDRRRVRVRSGSGKQQDARSWVLMLRRGPGRVSSWVRREHCPAPLSPGTAGGAHPSLAQRPPPPRTHPSRHPLTCPGQLFRTSNTRPSCLVCPTHSPPDHRSTARPPPQSVLPTSYKERAPIV